MAAFRKICGLSANRGVAIYEDHVRLKAWSIKRLSKIAFSIERAEIIIILYRKSLHRACIGSYVVCLLCSSIVSSYVRKYNTRGVVKRQIQRETERRI